ncbi:MAG: 3'-5' exonuclease [Chitinophagales bacterium]|nr:3'-5' exonuclease [Chitinophagales bacterium]
MDFVALDFETANELNTSACEIGIAVVRHYKIVETKSWLIRPPQNRFNPYNTMLHGISADDVDDAMNFKEVWQELLPYFEDQLLVAHNAAFDMNVMRSLLLHYEVPFKPIPYTCSIKVARKVWKDDAKRFGLSHMSKFLGIQLDHHRAESDAMACAEIASRGFREFQISFKEEIESKLNIVLGSITQQALDDTKNKFNLTIPKTPPRKRRKHW